MSVSSRTPMSIPLTSTSERCSRMSAAMRPSPQPTSTILAPSGTSSARWRLSTRTRRSCTRPPWTVSRTPPIARCYPAHREFPPGTLPVAMRSLGSRALLLILAVALIARLAVIVATPDFHPIFDAAHYDRLGASIADGHGYPGQFVPPTPSAFRPPLYPFALAAVHLLGGGWTAERVLGALLGVVAVLLVFLVGDRL